MLLHPSVEKGRFRGSVSRSVTPCFRTPFRSHRSGGWLGGFHHVATELRDVLPRLSLVFDFAFRAASWFS